MSLKKFSNVINKKITFKQVLPFMLFAVLQNFIAYGPFTHHLTHKLGFSRGMLEVFEYVTVPITVFILCMYVLQFFTSRWSNKTWFVFGYVGALLLSILTVVFAEIPHVDTVFGFMLGIYFLSIFLIFAFVFSRYRKLKLEARYDLKINKVSRVVLGCFFYFVFLFALILFLIGITGIIGNFYHLDGSDVGALLTAIIFLVIFPVLSGFALLLKNNKKNNPDHVEVVSF
jgi:hypothetical protein